METTSAFAALKKVRTTIEADPSNPELIRLIAEATELSVHLIVLSLSEPDEEVLQKPAHDLIHAVPYRGQSGRGRSGNEWSIGEHRARLEMLGEIAIRLREVLFS